MIASIRHQHELSKKLDLINSIDGIGLQTAVAILAACLRSAITQEQALVKLTPGRTFGREYEIYPTKGMQKEWMQKYRCVQIFTLDQIYSQPFSDQRKVRVQLRSTGAID